jgi:hypothetical protein
MSDTDKTIVGVIPRPIPLLALRLALIQEFGEVVAEQIIRESEEAETVYRDKIKEAVQGLGWDANGSPVEGRLDAPRADTPIACGFILPDGDPCFAPLPCAAHRSKS